MRNRIAMRDGYYCPANFDYLEAQNYYVLKEIGQGSYGVVYKAEDRSQKQFCAIKINFNIITRDQLYIEMALLRLLKGKARIPQLYNIIERKCTFNIVMQFCPSKPFITFFTTFNILEIKHYLYELLMGLKELKEAGIYHRDIKPSNFLYDPIEKRGAIVDFGLAEVDGQFIRDLELALVQEEEDQDGERELRKKLQIYHTIEKCLESVGINKIGTQIYMPPESMLRAQNQTYSSDIWPVGVIFLQFCTRRYNFFSNITRIAQMCRSQKTSFLVSYLLQLGCLFGREPVMNVCRDIFNHELILPDLDRINIKDICIIDGFDDHCLDLLTKLLELNPVQRISVQDALEHPFFEGIAEQHEQEGIGK